MREIEIVSTSDGMKYLLVGFDTTDTGSFRWQLWIEKKGLRMIDWLSPLGQNFISFMGGDLWVHNSDTAPRANLFGEQKDVKIGIVANEDSVHVKVFNSLGVHSDTQWEVESIVIPPSLNRPAGMYSELPKEHFKKRNGVWRAHFLRNLKSASATESVTDAVRGEELKGYYMYMILKNVNNPSGEQFKLFKVDVDMDVLRGQ